MCRKLNFSRFHVLALTRVLGSRHILLPTYQLVIMTYDLVRYLDLLVNRIYIIHTFLIGVSRRVGGSEHGNVILLLPLDTALYLVCF